MLSYILLGISIVLIIGGFVMTCGKIQFNNNGMPELLLLIAFGCFIWSIFLPTSDITKDIQISKMPNISCYYETNTDDSSFTYFDKDLKTIETVRIDKDNIKVKYEDDLNQPYIKLELDQYLFGKDEPNKVTVYLNSKDLKEDSYDY